MNISHENAVVCGPKFTILSSSKAGVIVVDKLVVRFGISLSIL